MLYNQPFGVPDPNAPYYNGNPDTGNMGSIPPAAAIEFPQREILSVITRTGQTPTNTDLEQLARGIQSNQLNYAIDTGTVNQLQITKPPLTAYIAGQRFSILVAHSNTGPATLNINALGPKPIHYPNGIPLGGNEMITGTIVSLIYDGVGWQMQNIASNLMAAPVSYYVNINTGDDNLFDGTLPTIAGSQGPFRTIQKAIDTAIEWNQNGFGIQINVADGTYPPFVTRPINGSGGITVQGNIVNPAGVLIHATAGEAIQIGAPIGWFLYGLKVQSDAAGTNGHGSHGIRCAAQTLNLANIDFGACKDAHIMCDSGAVIAWLGADVGMNTFYTVSGDSPIHFLVPANAYMWLGRCELRVPAVRNIGVWAEVYGNSTMNGMYSAMVGAANVIGMKYNVFQNGVILTGQGVGYFPGNVAGVTSTGGQVA
jgi:hypothetical protein